ncbi:MAG TPA: NAD+ synthase [Spirochaetaceae bacterium]|jgi:NAD+ synthase (glutamine-hydrolysing)|nr:NAD+ synthase [Spirochaetaceae bacterium]
MRLALCQIDPLIGAFDANVDAILAALDTVAPRQPDLVVFPEMAIAGYPPMDLLGQPGFAEREQDAFRRLQRSLPSGIAVAVGHIGRNESGLGRPLTNEVAVLLDGQVAFRQAKTLLPTYDVFDEARYFEPARERRVWIYKGLRIGFAVCEDLWSETEPVPGLRYPIDPPRELLDAGARLIVVPSASPFQMDKLALRQRLCSDLARRGGVPVAYCNVAGANDSLIFDGRSFLVGSSGTVEALGPFGRGELIVDILTDVEAGLAAADKKPSPAAKQGLPALPERWDEAERALVEGIRGYMAKCGFTKAHLGLSGGIDSALVAVLAAKAIGPENLVCITMPSRFSSSGSVDDSAALCAQLGCRMEHIAIEAPFSAFLSIMESHFAGSPFGLTEENLQARIRGDILMAWSNKFDSMLLTTGNKSELAVGYCTLYGDMCGALAPIGDLLKTEVFALCERLYQRDGLIPRAIIDKPPSAELRPNQLDQDSLPPYADLDAVLRLYIDRDMDADAIIALGHDESMTRRVLRMTARAEYKRRQAAPVLKLSPRAFGVGRRMPMARAAYEAD